MAKLTKHTKLMMIEELIKNGKFAENIKTKEREIEAVGDEIYRAIFGKYLDEIKKLPREFFHHSKAIRLQGIPSAKNNFRTDVHLSDYRPITADYANIQIDFHGLTATDEIIRKYHIAEQAYEDEVKKEKQARAEADALLSNVNTFKQLWLMWPESQSLLGKFENQDKPNYPLVPQNIVNINAAFGLPVEG